MLLLPPCDFAAAFAAAALADAEYERVQGFLGVTGYTDVSSLGARDRGLANENIRR